MKKKKQKNALVIKEEVLGTSKNKVRSYRLERVKGTCIVSVHERIRDSTVLPVVLVPSTSTCSLTASLYQFSW